MNIVNNVNLDEMDKTIEMVRINPEEAKKTVTIEGEWFPQALTGPQFSAIMATEKGDVTLSSDEPTFLGGSGSTLNPIQYCVYGACSCYAATYAKWAAFEGVILKNFKIKATANLDLSRALGLSQNPVIKEMFFELFVETDADDEKLAKVEKIAYDRCPAVYCLTSSVGVKTKVTRL
ncbi:MAG: OsmC family protein [Candidatus Heimdallarchaeota archaeon]